ARTQFYQCLGTSYYACMNLFNILDTSDPDFVNAFDYTRTFLGLEFMCNAGFEEKSHFLQRGLLLLNKAATMEET
ncbi:hypothetical protein ANCDUO_19828, partial [Ancylostoma duodenale]